MFHTPSSPSASTTLHDADHVDGEEASPAPDDTQPLRSRVVVTPPLARASIAPKRWPQSALERLFGYSRDVAPSREADCPPTVPSELRRAGTIRRVGLALLTLLQTWMATDFMTTVLPYRGTQPLEIAILALFAVLFAWISAGFWTAIAGFFLLWRGKDRYAISASAQSTGTIDSGVRTAVVMPICNEDVARVFAGLRATYESVARTGQVAQFDFFVLSDSADPDKRAAEQAAWMELVQAVRGSGRIFYRWRRHRIKRKSGNVADFCRRWGNNYRYMIVLDADSVMTGECITRLVRMMEGSPAAGIIQTIPRAAGRDTLHARIQQFAANVYGPVFAAGLLYWQLGESHYWGHNAIIRVAPFMRYCALRRLPGRGVLSGEILSHDFVEAALMRRAGWGVWIAYDVAGSYEEMPPNLIDEIKRDRRWCQGNLMNFRLVAMDGVHPVHRAVFTTGVLAYVSSPLWFLALLLSTALLAVHMLSEPVYFVESYQLFPLWPEWRPERAIALFSTTLSLLFLPKLLSLLVAIRHGARAFGGALRLTASVCAEMIVSALLAPIRMLFHTQFVTVTLAGRAVQWKSPPREDAETSWGEAARRHGAQSVLGIAWIAGVYWLSPGHVWWLLPVAGAMALSIPLSVFLSRASLGRRLRSAGLFLIPEEAQGSVEMRRTAALTRLARVRADFVRVVVDPRENARARAVALRGHDGAAGRRAAQALLQHALLQGPGALSARDKMALLDDAFLLGALHELVTQSPQAAPGWRQAAAAQPPEALEQTEPRDRSSLLAPGTA
jgi:membrane glycosyltransferase